MKNRKKKGHMLAALLLALALCVTAVPAQIVQAAAAPMQVHPQKLTLNEGHGGRNGISDACIRSVPCFRKNHQLF